MNNCKDCTKRTPACHDRCSTYKAFKDKLNTQNKFLKAERDSERLSLEGFWRRVSTK